MVFRCPIVATCLTVLTCQWIIGCAAQQRPLPSVPTAQPTCLRDQRVTLGADSVEYDLYLPASSHSAPLVVVAHGFSRSKTNMAGWGEKLAEEGFVAAVPTLPAWSDHQRNGRAINKLIDWLCTTSPHAQRIQKDRVGVMGFSAGGLSTLLAAADNSAIALWVGLDPVDRNGWGAAAAARLQAKAVILRAEPSPWNDNGNAATIERRLGGRCQSVRIPGAVHIDAEWPTDWAAELMCGRSDEQKRAAFVADAVTALKSVLMTANAQTD
jgi:dienelactone hydrolase